MRRRLLSLLLPPLLFSAAASACAFAAVGAALHGAASGPWVAAGFYAPFGAVAGLLSAALHLAFRRLPVQDLVHDRSSHGETPAAALARSVLAQMASARPARSASRDGAAPATQPAEQTAGQSAATSAAPATPPQAVPAVSHPETTA